MALPHGQTVAYALDPARLLIQCQCSTPQPISALRLSSPRAHFCVIGWCAQWRSSLRTYYAWTPRRVVQ